MRNITLVSLFLVFYFMPVIAAVSVGSSPGLGSCSFSSIQAALDSGNSSIRVLNNQDFVENLVVDHSVDIRGGYSSCTTANIGVITSSTKTTIKGSATAGESVIKISTSNNPTIRLYNLNLTDAEEVGSNPGKGHGVEIDGANGTIEINDSLIYLNKSNRGAGVFAVNNNNLLTVVIRNTILLGNLAASKGGGIYCQGNGVTIKVIEESSLVGNRAVDGGGIYANSGCYVLLSSGIDVANNSNVQRGVMLNTATNNGGGIYANLFARIDINATLYDGVTTQANSSPATVAKNTALNGGGIYANLNSIVNIIDGLIDDNDADGNGAGLYITSQSFLDMQSSALSCWNNGSCSVVSNNKAVGFGGAVFLNGAAETSINTSHIFGNRASSGTAFHFSDDGTMASVKGSYIYDNGDFGNGVYDDNFVISTGFDADVTLLHNTITDNNINNVTTIISNNNATISLKNSIVHNNNAVMREFGSFSTVASCLIVNESVTISGANVNIQSPGFISSANQNYHLSSNSFAIDMCAFESFTGLDTDNESRGFDDASMINIAGSYDVGADETYVNDVIFENSFE